MSLFTLLCGLDESRYEPYVIFGDEGSLNDEMTQMGIVAYRCPRRAALADVPLLLKAMSIIRKHRIQLVYLNCALKYSQVVGYAAKTLGVPVVWHVRENPYSNRVLKRRKPIANIATSLFVVSHEQKAAFADLGTPLRHIANGVVVDRFVRPNDVAEHRQRLGVSASTLVFCIVGTIEPRKGTEMLVTEFAKLVDAGKDVALLIVGDGPEQYMESLYRVLSGVSEAARSRVSLLGRVANVGPVMWAADVLVMPSTWEGFPRSLIEAMVAGLPAIATDVGDTKYILRDGVTGWVIPPNDPESLSAAMSNAVLNASALPEMGRKAAADALSQYTADKYAETMQGAFDDVLNRSVSAN